MNCLEGETHEALHYLPTNTEHVFICTPLIMLKFKCYERRRWRTVKYIHDSGGEQSVSMIVQSGSQCAWYSYRVNQRVPQPDMHCGRSQAEWSA